MNRLVRNAPCLAVMAMLMAFVGAFGGPAWAGREVDNSIYARLLGDHVRGAVVDYAGLKAEEAVLDAYLDVLERVRPVLLDDDERLAFWLNVYNAWTLKLVLGAYPGLSGIKDLGGWFTGPWDLEIVRADGRLLSLDEVEHGIIRTEFREPRIHFAVNCASKSCPALLNRPYRGATLDRDLGERTAAFINDPARNRFHDGVLELSSIFKWYAEDFGDVVDFVRLYARGELARSLDGAGEVEVEYLDYDWSLNGL